MGSIIKQVHSTSIITDHTQVKFQCNAHEWVLPPPTAQCAISHTTNSNTHPAPRPNELLEIGDLTEGFGNALDSELQ